MLFRPRRELLDEAMREVFEFNTFDELLTHINLQWKTMWDETSDVFNSLEFEHQGFDPRINWDTYFVIGYVTKLNKFVIGYTNGDPTKIEVKE